MKLGLKTIISLFGLVSLIGCGSISNSLTSSTDYNVIDKSVLNVKTKDGLNVMPFNTIVTLRTFCEKDHNDIFPKFNAEIQRLHILFDRYNDFVDNQGKDIINLRDINDSYGEGKVLTVDEDLIQLLKFSIELSILTEGYFNPTLGELIDTWNYRYEDGNKYVRFSPYCFDEIDPLENDIQQEEFAQAKRRKEQRHCQEKQLLI